MICDQQRPRSDSTSLQSDRSQCCLIKRIFESQFMLAVSVDSGPTVQTRSPICVYTDHMI